MNRGFPLTRLTPWYPGQMGVPGSDNTLGLRTVPQTKVLYVDHNHPDASDAHDGTDPDHPKQTIQAAVNSALLEPGDLIIVGPATIASTYVGISQPNYHENVLVANTRPAFVTLMAVGTGPFQVVWDKAAAAATTVPLLDIRTPGWVVKGFKFHAPALGAAIRLRDVSENPLDNTQYTVIEGNYFDGAWAGKYGIELRGAPGNIVIRDNWFLEHHQAGGNAFALISTDTGNADPYECIVEGNVFMENDNHVDVSFGMSLIRGNAFHLGKLLATAIKLDLRGGTVGTNLVTQNVMPGDYSNVGGYYGNAANPDTWISNLAPDVLEAEVGASGFTILPPAP